MIIFSSWLQYIAVAVEFFARRNVDATEVSASSANLYCFASFKISWSVLVGFKCCDCQLVLDVFDLLIIQENKPEN